MSDRWNEFLEDQGLRAEADGYTHMTDETVDMFQKLSGDTICDLTHLGLVGCSGDDAEDFLQNQLSNDVAALVDRESMAAGYCNPKGRLICIFNMRRRDGGFSLQLPMDLRDSVIAHLRKYVLRARVRLEADTDTVMFGVSGSTTAKGLEKIAGALPSRDGEIAGSDALSVLKTPGNGRPRFQLLGSANACIAAWEKLRPRATVVGSWAWSRLDILAGIPNIHSVTSGLFIPQTVNLDLLGGVNFRKGCYPGQEIVARMHYLGNLKQRMARFRTDAGTRPLPGDRVFTQGSNAPTGTVVDAQAGAGTGWDLLAVVRLADLETPQLRIGSENGAPLFHQELPYPLPESGQRERA